MLFLPYSVSHMCLSMYKEAYVHFIKLDLSEHVKMHKKRDFEGSPVRYLLIAMHHTFKKKNKIKT